MEKHECVKIFCFLGDILDGDGGADLATTARIRNGLMKFRELLPFLTSRAPPLGMKGRVYASCVSMTNGSQTVSGCPGPLPFWPPIYYTQRVGIGVGCIRLIPFVSLHKVVM